MKAAPNYYRSQMNEPIPISISGEVDFGVLLERLSDDIVKASAFFRIDKKLNECFETYGDEKSQAEFFWEMVNTAVPEAWQSRLCRIYDQEKSALSLRTLLATIKANMQLFGDEAVRKRLSRVNPSFAQSIAPGSHLPDPKTLEGDLAAVSCGDRLVKKVVLWRGNFWAHVSPRLIIKKKRLDGSLPTYDDAFKLCERAFVVFNRYSSLFRAAVELKEYLGEKGSVESVFRLLRCGLAAGRRERAEAAERLLEATRTSNQS